MLAYTRCTSLNPPVCYMITQSNNNYTQYMYIGKTYNAWVQEEECQLSQLYQVFPTDTPIVENVFVWVKNKCCEHSKAYQLLYKAMARLEQVKQELVFIEKDSAWLVYRKQDILAFVERTKRSSMIDYGAIIDMPRGLSFNFSGINLSLEDWSSLLSVPIGSPKAAIYSRSNYPQVPRYICCLYTLSTL